jgi:TfoX/Sxy family transcriptional regulator of competence genes
MNSKEDLAAQVRAALAGAGAVREVTMFGGIGFMLNGNLIAGASPRGLLVRVGKDRQAEALGRPGARPMVMRGRTMSGYVRVAAPALDAVPRWVQLAVPYVQALPPKSAARKSRPAGGKSKGKSTRKKQMTPSRA